LNPPDEWREPDAVKNQSDRRSKLDRRRQTRNGRRITDPPFDRLKDLEESGGVPSVISAETAAAGSDKRLLKKKMAR
jgi:hypothetical protein